MKETNFQLALVKVRYTPILASSGASCWCHPECELVENGMIAMPVSMQMPAQDEYYKYAYYTIIMPRRGSRQKSLKLQKS